LSERGSAGCKGKGDGSRELSETRRVRCRLYHGLRLRRIRRGLACTRYALYAGAFAGRGAPHPGSDAVPDLGGVEIELGQGSAKGVAMHAKLFRGFALISFVVGENFKEIAALELA